MILITTEAETNKPVAIAYDQIVSVKPIKTGCLIKTVSDAHFIANSFEEIITILSELDNETTIDDNPADDIPEFLRDSPDTNAGTDTGKPESNS